jgi:hypothetical protein
MAVVLTIFSRYLGAGAARRNDGHSHQLPAWNRSLIGVLSESWAMTTFDKREEAFEKKFAIDEEQKFKAIARRNRLLGLWIADRLGITGDAAGAYAKEVIASEFDGTGDAGVSDKIARDLAAKGVSLGEDELQAKMSELMAEAIVQVKAGI